MRSSEATPLNHQQLRRDWWKLPRLSSVNQKYEICDVFFCQEEMLFLALSIWPRDRFWDLLFTRAAWRYCELLPLRKPFVCFADFYGHSETKLN